MASGEFFNQTYSAKESVQVGEDRVNKVFMAQFSFMSRTPAHQPGLFLSVSPDSHEGSRMSWVGLEDTPEGIQVTAADAPEVDGKFVDYDLALLDRTQPHTIRFWIEVKPGPDNDLVRIAVDDRDTGQCFTTWENYYRTAPEQAPPPNANTPADINSLQFRSSVQGPAALLTSGGYLFDNVSITPSNGPGPPRCRLVIDKEADSRTVRAGGLVGYRITARNRGRGSDRNVQLCDRIPRGTRFVSANRKLRRIGRRRCLVIPRLRAGERAGFHLTLRVNANAAPGTLENIADITPGVEPPGSGTSPTTESPNLPGGTGREAAGPARAGSARTGQDGQGPREGAGTRPTSLHRLSKRHPRSASWLHQAAGAGPAPEADGEQKRARPKSRPLQPHSPGRAPGPRPVSRGFGGSGSRRVGPTTCRCAGSPSRRRCRTRASRRRRPP